MDKENFDEEFKKLWNETPVSNSESEKEACWTKFHSKTFAKKKKTKPWRYYAAAAVLLFVLIGTGIFFKNNASQQEHAVFAANVIENTSSKIKFVVLPDSSK